MVAQQHEHPEYATIREVLAIKDDILKSVTTSQRTIQDSIKAGFDSHAKEHANGLVLSRESHQELEGMINDLRDRVDSFLEQKDHQVYFRQGQLSAVNYLLATLKILNEYKWLLILIVSGIAMMLGNLQIGIGKPAP